VHLLEVGHIEEEHGHPKEHLRGRREVGQEEGERQRGRSKQSEEDGPLTFSQPASSLACCALTEKAATMATTKDTKDTMSSSVCAMK
jgi:hypothetical protein